MLTSYAGIVNLYVWSATLPPPSPVQFFQLYVYCAVLSFNVADTSTSAPYVYLPPPEVPLIPVPDVKLTV